jgi:hypothetical protein
MLVDVQALVALADAPRRAQGVYGWADGHGSASSATRSFGIRRSGIVWTDAVEVSRGCMAPWLWESRIQACILQSAGTIHHEREEDRMGFPKGLPWGGATAARQRESGVASRQAPLASSDQLSAVAAVGSATHAR